MGEIIQMVHPQTVFFTEITYLLIMLILINAQISQNIKNHIKQQFITQKKEDINQRKLLVK